MDQNGPLEVEEDDAVDVAVLRDQADRGDELAQWALAVGGKMTAEPDEDFHVEREGER